MVLSHNYFLLMNVLSANMLGMKINHYDAVCPRTKVPLFLMNQERNSVNSSKNCFPFVIVMGQESTQMIQENFADVIKLMCDASTDSEETEFSTKYGYKSFRTIITPDMSARWKGSDKGGAAKISTEFCDCCECDSANIAQCRPVTCEKWCRFDGRMKCYHWPMATEEMIGDLRN